MLNSKKNRELAYVVTINDIIPIDGADRVEVAAINGWRVMVQKGQFKPGDFAIYFEIDSKVPATETFKFMEKYDYKVKTQKYFKGTVISQGLLMAPSDFGWETLKDSVVDTMDNVHFPEGDTRFLTSVLGVTYSVDEDNTRKASYDKYQSMMMRHKKLFQKFPFNVLAKSSFGKQLLYIFFGKKKDNKTCWPTGRFPGVNKTDQERCENMPWVLEDKTPYIVTQKCDGSSGTYILERKPFGQFEFYVCSRNVRMLSPSQECFYGKENYYWEVAIKYDIENKMKEWLKLHPDETFVCWQGEICAPGIQKNPQHLKETHFFAFHWTDSVNGRMDITEAATIWKGLGLETVPIIDTHYILPDDFEEFKDSADGLYDPSVCEGNENCAREGFVYYKTSDPTSSFKNVSRKYLLKHNS